MKKNKNWIKNFIIISIVISIIFQLNILLDFMIFKIINPHENVNIKSESAININCEEMALPPIIE